MEKLGKMMRKIKPNRKYEDYFGYTSDIKEDQVFNCKFCDHSVTTERKLKLHLNSKHKEVDVNNVSIDYNTVIKQELLVCEYCDYNCYKKQILLNHIKQRHRIRKLKNAREHSCELCDFKCNKRCFLLEHIAHKHKGHSYRRIKKEAPCDDCGFICSGKCHLDTQKGKHEGQNFECLEDACGFRGNRVKQLRLHLQTKHQMEFTSFSFAFNNTAEFDKWLKEVEREHECEFLLAFSTKGHVQNYMCCANENRTSTIQQRHSGKSKKHQFKGPPCTATIKRILNADGSISVTATLKHYGHKTCVQMDDSCLPDMKQMMHVKQDVFNCSYCIYCSANKRTLQNHISVQHKEEHRMVKSIGKEELACDYCLYTCYNKRTLLTHIRCKHKPSVVEYRKHKEGWQCDSENCHLTFATKRELQMHRAMAHVKKTNIICLEENCNFRGVRLNQLHTHLRTEHNFSFDFQSLLFISVAEFNTWLQRVEKENICRFVVYSLKDSTKYYICNRSGAYVSQASGLRLPKAKGSCKMGASCTATIKRVLLDDGTVAVKANLSHYGHEMEVEHLRLTKEERLQLQEKLIHRIPLDKICKEAAYNPVESNKVQRINLIRRHDLHNLSKSLNEGIDKQDVDDSITVDALISMWKDEQKAYLHIIKLEGELSEEYENEGLHKDDFAIGFSSLLQLEELHKFAHDGICVEVHNGSTYSLVIVLIVKEESHMSYPVAWCISNRIDEPLVSLFFAGIASNLIHIGMQIPKPKFFMSANIPSLYDGWVAVTNYKPQKLLYFSDVLSDWHHNLTLIKDYEMQGPIFKCMNNILLEESHEKSLLAALELQKSLLKDPVTKEFGEYFHDVWMSQGMFGQWSFCNRKGVFINSNLPLKNFIKNFKKKFLFGKKISIASRCLSTLLSYSQESEEEDDRKINESHQQKLSFKRHMLATEVDSSEVKNTDNSLVWIVQSQVKKVEDEHTVRLETFTCTESPPCEIRCNECMNICIHMYNCTCKDYCLNSLICKHIHLACMNFPPFDDDEEENETVSDDENEVELDEKVFCDEIKSEFCEVSIATPSDDGENSRHKFYYIRNYITAASALVNDISDQCISEVDLSVLEEMKREVYDVVTLAKVLDKSKATSTTFHGVVNTKLQHS